MHTKSNITSEGSVNGVTLNITGAASMGALSGTTLTTTGNGTIGGALGVTGAITGSAITTTGKATCNVIANKGAMNYGATTNSGNDYSLALDSSIIAYTDGLIVMFKANATSTGATTINVNTIGAKKMIKNSDKSTQLTTDDVVANAIYIGVYNSSADTGTGAFMILDI
jgi:hypothetical protein